MCVCVCVYICICTVTNEMMLDQIGAYDDHTRRMVNNSTDHTPHPPKPASPHEKGEPLKVPCAPK